MSQSFLRAWVADCCVWPFANTIGFRLVPTNLRPTFVSVVVVGWQSYMSSIGHPRPKVRDETPLTRPVDESSSPQILGTSDSS